MHPVPQQRHIAQMSFQSGAIKPMECIKEGWELLRGQYWLFFAITFVGLLVAGAVPLGLFLGPMMCGIHLCFQERMRNRPVEFATLFKGVDHFVQSLIATLFQIIPAAVVIVPLYIYFVIEVTSLERMNRTASPTDFLGIFVSFGLLFLVAIAFSLIASLFYTFVYPLISDRKLSGLEAITLSFKAVLGNIGGLIGLFALNILLSIAGILLCGVGLYFVLPLSFASYAIAYRQVFPDLASGGVYPQYPYYSQDSPAYGPQNQYPPHQ